MLTGLNDSHRISATPCRAASSSKWLWRLAENPRGEVDECQPKRPLIHLLQRQHCLQHIAPLRLPLHIPLQLQLAGFDIGIYRIANYGCFLVTYPGSFIDPATTGQVNPVVVPEPGSAILLLAGLGAMLGRRRRQD